VPAGSELNEGLGRTTGVACEHAAGLGFDMGGNSGGAARGEGKDMGAARSRRKNAG